MRKFEEGEDLFERIKKAATRSPRYDSSASRFLARDATTRRIAEAHLAARKIELEVTQTEHQIVAATGISQATERHLLRIVRTQRSIKAELARSPKKDVPLAANLTAGKKRRVLLYKANQIEHTIDLVRQSIRNDRRLKRSQKNPPTQ